MSEKLLERYICESRLLLSPGNVITTSKGGKNYYYCEADAKVRDDYIRVKIVITDDFPKEPPFVLLPTFDSLGFLPHIEPNGKICFLEKESIYINTEEPDAVFHASLEMALATIEEGVSGKNLGDFREELNAFWNRNKDVLNTLVITKFNVGKKIKKLSILANKRKVIAVDKERNLELEKQLHFKRESQVLKTGIFIPFTKSKLLLPPKYDESWDAESLIRWIKEHTSEEDWTLIQEEYLKKKPSRVEYLFFGIPRNTGLDLVVGVKLTPATKNKHPLVSKESDWLIQLLKVDRLDREGFLPRGGGISHLQTKRVMVIGCGSVGSHLAVDLAKLGVGYLTLVDNDILKIENVQRFSVGFGFVGKKKVEAIKDFIKSNYLLTSCTAAPLAFESITQESNSIIEGHDLIISATGDPTVNFEINKVCRELNIPFICGWNEPLGIGGHSLTSIPSSKGCYKCLFKENYNRASFADQEQEKPFHVKHLGCGEVYTPYNALDSVKTSELMARASIKVLSEKANESEIMSWKGDSAAFIEQGFKLSKRYFQPVEQIEDKKSEFKNEDCLVCNNDI